MPRGAHDNRTIASVQALRKRAEDGTGSLDLQKVKEVGQAPPTTILWTVQP